MPLRGWGRGDDKSAGKRRCCCVLVQPQPRFGLLAALSSRRLGKDMTGLVLNGFNPSDNLIYSPP